MGELEVGDIVRLQTVRGYRVWKVTGIYLGGVDHEDLVGLMPLDLNYGSAHGKPVDEALVPRDIVSTLAMV